MVRSLPTVLLALLIALCVSGCAGVRWYSETRDKQGQAAAKAWSAVDLKGFFAAERENDDKLLEQELATSARRIAADRDVVIRDLAQQPLSSLPDYYDTALAELVTDGTPPIANPDRAKIEENIRNARNAARGIAQAGDQLDRQRSFLAQAGAPRFNCDDLAESDRGAVGAWVAEQPDKARSVSGRLTEAARLCADIVKHRQAHRAALKAFGGGRLKTMVGELEKAEARLSDEQALFKKARAAYVAALAEYRAELAKQAQGESAREKAAALAGKVKSALSAIDNLQGVLKESFIAEERIKRINDLLGDLKVGKEPGPDASKTEIAVLLLPELADDVRAVSEARTGVGVVPLLIKRDVEQARLNAAQVEIASLESEIALHEAAIESALAEARYITNARSIFLERANAQSPAGKSAGLDKIDAPLYTAWGALKDPQQKFTLLESVGLYLDAVGRQRASTERLQRMRYALAKREATALSEVNAGMWSSLIGATVTQAAEFAATGLKASDFENILQTLGILWIGHGVNK